MSLLQNIRNYCSILSVATLLCSCSSAVFPEIIEDDQSNVGGSMEEESSFTTKKGSKIELAMPQEGNSLKSDDKNIAYEGEDDEALDNAMSSDNFENDDDIKPAKTKPIFTKPSRQEATSYPVPQSSDLSEEETIVEPTFMTAEDNSPSVSYRIETIYFNNGSSVVDSQYNSKLREVVKLAKSKKNAVVKVLGFASSRTRNTDAASHKLANFSVSSERANNVANALKRYGLKASQIEVEALSDTAPVYQEVMPEGERLNRRAEVYITY